MNWDSKTNISLGFVLALCSCIAIAALGYRSTQRLIAANRSVVHTDEVLQELQATLEEVTQSETAERGFILTGDDRYLQIHQSAVQISYEGLLNLQHLTSDNPRQQARWATLDKAIRQKIEWQNYLSTVMKESGAKEASRLVATRKGQQLTDTIRGLVAEMTSEEQQLLRQRTDIARVSATSTLAILTLFGIATAFFLSFAYFLILRDLRARDRVQAKLEITQEQLREALEVEKELARIDPLTTLANRRAFFEATEAEAARAGRFGQTVTLAYLDVDNLKHMNDNYGHSVGDSVLKYVARTLRACVRATDFPARLGGDEFALLLPNTDFPAAQAVLNKLRQKLLETVEHEGWPVTFSIGAAVFGTPVPPCSQMLTIADGIMYSVKSRGKNAVLVQVVSNQNTTSANSATD
jgi:diguanylate cyclase (GGDEF)-like protein